MKPFLSQFWSDLFYQRALGHRSAFRMKDIASPSEIDFAKLWLQQLVERGELRRIAHFNQKWYEWIND
jgi:hypothetical protein